MEDGASAPILIASILFKSNKTVLFSSELNNAARSERYRGVVVYVARRSFVLLFGSAGLEANSRSFSSNVVRRVLAFLNDAKRR